MYVNWGWHGCVNSVLHFTLCMKIIYTFEKYTKVEKIHVPDNHNYEIAKLWSQSISMIISTTNVISLTSLIHNHLHIFIILFRFLYVWDSSNDTESSMSSPWRQCAHGPPSYAGSFANTQFATAGFGIWLANFSFLLYQNQFIHVMAGCHWVLWDQRIPWIVRSDVFRGYSDRQSFDMLANHSFL